MSPWQVEFLRDLCLGLAWTCVFMILGWKALTAKTYGPWVFTVIIWVVFGGMSLYRTLDHEVTVNEHNAQECHRQGGIVVSTDQWHRTCIEGTVIPIHGAKRWER